MTSLSSQFTMRRSSWTNATLESEAAGGAVVVRASVWAGLPYLHLTYRVFNGSDRHRRLDLSRLTLTAGEAPWQGLPEVRCLEADAQNPGPDGLLSQAGFGVGVRYFWQQFPKAIAPANATTVGTPQASSCQAM